MFFFLTGRARGRAKGRGEHINRIFRRGVFQTFRASGVFLESSGNFSVPKSGFMFTVLAFRIKVSVIENDTMKVSVDGCEQETFMVLFNGVLNLKFAYGHFEKRGPWDLFLESPGTFSGPESCFVFAGYL